MAFLALSSSIQYPLSFFQALSVEEPAKAVEALSVLQARAGKNL